MKGMVFRDVTHRRTGYQRDRMGVHITAGDINNDGWLDIFVNGFNYSQLYINQRNGTFGMRLSIRASSKVVSMALRRGCSTMTMMAIWISWPRSLRCLINTSLADLVRSPRNTSRNQSLRGTLASFPTLSKYGRGHFTEIGSEAGLIAVAVMGGQFIEWSSMDDSTSS